MIIICEFKRIDLATCYTRTANFLGLLGEVVLSFLRFLFLDPTTRFSCFHKFNFGISEMTLDRSKRPKCSTLVFNLELRHSRSSRECVLIEKSSNIVKMCAEAIFHLPGFFVREYHWNRDTFIWIWTKVFQFGSLTDGVPGHIKAFDSMEGRLYTNRVSLRLYEKNTPLVLPYIRQKLIVVCYFQLFECKTEILLIP